MDRPTRSQMNCVSSKTIRKMEEKGAPEEHIAHAKATQYSMDANEVAFHRAYIQQYNRADPWREPNNWVMHPTNYQFGGGHRSPQYIGQMLGTLGQPVVIYGPAFTLHPSMQPHVVFNTDWRSY